METQIKLIGALLIVLALIHIIFPRYFNWKEELSSLNLVNRQMMIVHTFFIALTVMLMGMLCWTSAPQLVETQLGKKISLGLGIFWSIRFVFQVFIYSPKLWRGKTFETIVHIIFSVFWIYMSAIFFKNYLD